MEWLNYHHLYYFWIVSREGGLLKASKKLRLAPSTISTQIHKLEEFLGNKLFKKSGRKLVLTDVGKVVFGYAEEIFSLGREMIDVVKERPVDRPLRMEIGIVDVIPKLVIQKLISPALNLADEVKIICREGRAETLIAQLALHHLDIVLTDAPLQPGTNIQAYSHALGSSGILLFGTETLAIKYGKKWPSSLDGAPFLLPTHKSALRLELEHWFEKHQIRPKVVGEFDDSALLKAYGQTGMGIFASPEIIAEEIKNQYNIRAIGRLDGIHEKFYAISVERRLRHPGVMAIIGAARDKLFEQP